jgi:hypothetical protein
VRQIFIHRQKNIELARVVNQFEQPTVFDARPAGLRHGLHLAPGQIVAQTRRHTFIQQEAHQAGTSIRSLASSRKAMA